jgi:uncharacterized protein YndB with AHSA1/START domain
MARPGCEDGRAVPTTTRVQRTIAAPRAAVYAALLEPTAVQQWMVPDGMTSVVHEFDARAGGRFRISLTYDEGSGGVGKTSGSTDSYAGTFVRLVPGVEVVQAIEFDSDDPTMLGEMTVSYRLSDGPEGATTVVDATHEGVPDGVSAEDNETGWRMSLDKLAALVERSRRDG